MPYNPITDEWEDDIAPEVVRNAEMDAFDLVDVRMTGSGSSRRPAAAQPLTIANLRAICEWHGYKVRYNVMKGGVSLFKDGVELMHEAFEDAMNLITNQCYKLDINNVAKIDAFMFSIAQSDQYHPMLEWLEEVKWDGEDRIQALCETLPVANPKMRDVYVRKWLIQAMEGIAGWRKPDSRPMSLPHVLVFAGKQGVGKTSWLRRLGANKFLATECELHLNSGQSKDQQLQILVNPMAELSEIDATFKKSDVSSLKAFLSRPDDTIRAPYAARAVTRRRSTVFCGSVNSSEFLVDNTGSRRFWPLEIIDTIDFDHDIDMRQLWAQVNYEWETAEGSYPWVLTPEEDALRIADSEGFLSTPIEVEALMEHYNTHGAEWGNYIALPITEIMKALNVSNSPLVKANLKQWMEVNIGKPYECNGRRNSWPFPMRTRDLLDQPDEFRLTADYVKEKSMRWKARKLIVERKKRVRAVEGNVIDANETFKR